MSDFGRDGSQPRQPCDFFVFRAKEKMFFSELKQDILGLRVQAVTKVEMGVASGA